MGERVNVYLPDGLAAAVRERLPGLNLSAAVQATLVGLLECDHAVLSCDECSAELGRVELEAAGVRRFFGELVEVLEPLVWKGGTATGAAQLLYQVGRAWRVPAASGPLPRPTRAQREQREEDQWQRQKESA